MPSYSSKLYGGLVCYSSKSLNDVLIVVSLTFFSPLAFSLICLLHCRLPTPSTFDMVIPANAVGKVMGKGGANIANIRKVGYLFLSILSVFSR